MVGNFQLGENLGQGTHGAQHLSDQTVGAADRRIDLGPDSDEPAGNGVGQVVVLGLEGDDPGADRVTLETPLGVLGNDPRPDLDLHPELQHSAEDGPARYAALESGS